MNNNNNNNNNNNLILMSVKYISINKDILIYNTIKDDRKGTSYLIKKQSLQYKRYAIT